MSAHSQFHSTPSRDYAVGTDAHFALLAAINEVKNARFDIPCTIGKQEVRTGITSPIVAPHDHSLVLGQVHHADTQTMLAAIESAKAAASSWSGLSQVQRNEPFLRAAEMLSKSPWREKLNAATMLELSKTIYQADGDASAETVDFIRANLLNAVALNQVQPLSSETVSNHMEYRPLEGFVFSISPFNFTSMNNLAFAPALLGNVVVWKPAESSSLVAHLSLQLLLEAGLPAGVINLVHGVGSDVGPIALNHPDLAAVNFTGSTATFQQIWQTVGNGISQYRNYPRIVGETGGKGFVLAHPTADIEAVTVACVRGAFEYQGQKCSAASRLYVARSMWPELKIRITQHAAAIVMGDVVSNETEIGAVISERQFRKHQEVLAQAAADGVVVFGGMTDDSIGWFVQPTVLEVTDPHSRYMTEEFFAPIITVFVYEDSEWEQTVKLVDESTIYGLTGAVFCHDQVALDFASTQLRYAAGNFYINDKPSGAAVGYQPFGGSRASGTNDKVGTVWNLSRFVSPRTIKNNSAPATSVGPGF